MRYAQLTLEREQSARLLAWGIRFFLAAMLTASRAAGGYAPFALGCIAAAGAGADGAAALAGAAAGAVLFLDFSQALSFLAVGVLILTASTAFRGMRFLERPLAMPLISAVLVLAVGGIYVLQSLSPVNAWTPCVAAAGLTGVSTWFLRRLLRPEGGRPTADSLMFLGAALLLALGEVTFCGLSLGRILLCVLLLYSAYEQGALGGVSAGLGLGLVTDLCAGGGGGLFTAAYGVAGLLGGSRSRKISAAAAFLGGILAAVLTSQEQLALQLLLESVVGAAVFLLLPARFFGGKRVRRAQAAETETGGELKNRLLKAAGALRDLYDSMGREVPQPTEENPAIVFDRAAEQVCRGCALCELCWQKEYTGTFNALNDATPFLIERGRALAKDFPAYFSNRCIHLPEFLAAVDRELSAFLLRRQYRRQLEETRRSAKGQYAQMSDLLSATAAGLGETAPAFGSGECDCRIGAALRPKDGETVCGDTVVSFQTEQGDWCLLLADGMGSGEAARRESALTCRLLRQFLEAEIAPEAALKTLNAAMALRGAETGSFTTVDLCVFHGSGEVIFYKFGAAPSYLKKNGSVRRVTGASLPVGLRGTPAAPDITSVHLGEDSFVVMISDGVADPGRDEWLQDLLAGWDGEDPQALAGRILAESVRRERLQDDCAVQVLYRPKGSAKKV